MDTRTERGQVLLLVALALLALVAVVALAVDIGNVYRERRHMQNAADAGALAAAHEMCLGDVRTEAATIAAGQDYAVNRNGADGAVVTVNMPITATVLATKTVDTYFAGVIGFDEIPVEADATAICGKAAAAGGIWPVGFDMRRWTHLNDIGYSQCGRVVLIWEGHTNADCETYDCCTVVDKWGDEIVTIPDCSPETWENSPVPLDNQAWVDFSIGITGGDPCDSGGCGASEAIYRIDGEDNKGIVCESSIEFPDCFANPSGEKAAAWNAAEDAGGRVVSIPMYDPCRSGKLGDPPLASSPYCADYPESFTPPPVGVCEMTTSPGDNCTNERFYIMDLACLQIGFPGYPTIMSESDFDDADFAHVVGYLVEIPDDGKTTGLDKARVMLATIPCEDGQPVTDCASGVGWSTGEIPEEGDIIAVSLIE